VSRSHTPGRTPQSDQLVAETTLPTRHERETKSHSVIGVWTHNSSSRAATNLHLRWRSKWLRKGS